MNHGAYRPELVRGSKWHKETFKVGTALRPHIASVASCSIVEWWRQRAQFVDVDSVKDIVASVRREQASPTVHAHHTAAASALATAARWHRDGHVETHKARLGGVQPKWPELVRRQVRWRHSAVDDWRHWWRSYLWHVTCTHTLSKNKYAKHNNSWLQWQRI